MSRPSKQVTKMSTAAMSSTGRESMASVGPKRLRAKSVIPATSQPGPGRRSTPSTVNNEEKIKFDIERSFSEEKVVIPFGTSDETIRLYQSMPKGLEYFITTGPPKRVHDYTDYEKLCEAHERLKTELDVQRQPRWERFQVLSEKKLHFRNAVKSFNHFLVDMDRKEKRANAQLKKLKEEKKILEAQAPHLQAKLAALKNFRNIKLNKLARLSPVVEFVESIMKCPDISFKSFHDVMDRYAALNFTYRDQVTKYMDNMEKLESMREYYEIYVCETKQKILHLRTQLMEKKMEMDRVISLTRHLEQVLRGLQESEVKKSADYWRMNEGVQNMVTTLMDFRPFTIGRLRDKTDTSSQIEAIGIIIADYTRILKRLQDQMKPHDPVAPAGQTEGKLAPAHSGVEQNVEEENMSVSRKSSDDFIEV